MTTLCEDEWKDALEHCEEMFELLDHKDRFRGVTGKTIDDCMMGQISQACGGNSIL